MQARRAFWQHLRNNRQSNRVFADDEAIIEAACDAWRKHLAQPNAITLIRMLGRTHVGQRTRWLVL
ncbi:hypothetical protein [Aquibium sp. ELW1220]|uniref:hypothetical protein n=1 Tax=Aquibium sp. ELW1220 TaxID=2976766 RepID=UPI0025B1D171|nr:hypothetical protein [Aquibium sp. ELW1220]MDN2583440.1 hypothetical protein [Aquibium sp. ELW1220]